MNSSKSPTSKKRKLSKIPTGTTVTIRNKQPALSSIRYSSSVVSPRGENSFSVAVNNQEMKRRKDRKARFTSTTPNASTYKGSSSANHQCAAPKIGHKKIDPLYKPLTASRRGKDNEQKQCNGGQLVGENTNLEKPYLRLTTWPRKEDVRPLEILIKSLAHVKTKYYKEEDFDWANEQLKSIRQDLTVQRIRNAFVLDVYETHGRILLEHGDLNEFNQCQSMIRSLTEGRQEDGVGEEELTMDQQDSGSYATQSKESADEFRGYSILYALVRNNHIELKTQVARAVSTIAAAATNHALQVVRAISDYDFRLFFRLYESAPHMSAYLMDFLVKRLREGAYERIIAAYRPNIGVELIREFLCFSDLEETRRFLRQSGAVFDRSEPGPPFWVDCKATSKVLASTNAQN